MIFRQRFLEGIRDGSVTLAFRRWRRPSVRAGGTVLTAVGQLEIVSVDEVATTRRTQNAWPDREPRDWQSALAARSGIHEG
jgi:hypothetical protein